MAKKLSFDETLEALNEERFIDADDVRASALRRYVWLMMYSASGCLPDYRSISATKHAAIEDAIWLYADDAPRGFRTALRRDGIAATDDNGYYRVEITRVRVHELF